MRRACPRWSSRDYSGPTDAARGEVIVGWLGRTTTSIAIPLSRGFRYFCVFARELRRDRIRQAFLMPIDSSFARPGTSEVVFDLDSQHPHTLSLQFYDIPILEGVQAAMIGAGRDDVSRDQWVHCTQPSYAAFDVGNHLLRVEVLFDFAVHPKPNSQVLRI